MTLGASGSPVNVSLQITGVNQFGLLIWQIMKETESNWLVKVYLVAKLGTEYRFFDFLVFFPLNQTPPKSCQSCLLSLWNLQACRDHCKLAKLWLNPGAHILAALPPPSLASSPSFHGFFSWLQVGSMAWDLPLFMFLLVQQPLVVSSALTTFFTGEKKSHGGAVTSPLSINIALRKTCSLRVCLTVES